MSYDHLTPHERYVISHLRVAKYSLREIGRRLGRHHTTISREIKRNGPTYPGGVYWYSFIDPMVEKKRHTARSYRRQSHAPLVQYVEDKLRSDWPPEVIADRVRANHPHDERMRISHETIYRWVALDARQGGNLFRHLRRRRKY
jgi:IS30 family transposase